MSKRRVKMNKLWQAIDGHKTQIAAIATLLAGFATGHGWIPKETSDLVLGILAALLSGSIVHHEVKVSKGGK
jgi:hypothetical protein